MLFFRILLCCLRPQKSEDDNDTWRKSKDQAVKSSSASRRKWSRKLRRSSTSVPVAAEATAEGFLSTDFPSDLLQKNEELVSRHEGNDNWKEVKVLGQGSFGKVTLIENKGTNELMALKKVDIEDGASTTMEEVIHSQLSHKNIVQLFFWKNDGRNLQMYMEYCRRGSLESKVLDMTEEEAENYFDQVVAGVQYLHSRGVVHRDIKPANLLIAERETLKIADMGLSCVYVSEGKEVDLNGFAGTPAFMAPEQLASSPYRGPPVDVWSCGMVLFIVLTSARPWVKAQFEDPGFKRWAERDKVYLGIGPWERLRETSFDSLVFGLLAIDPTQRLSTWNDYVKRQSTKSSS